MTEGSAKPNRVPPGERGATTGDVSSPEENLGPTFTLHPRILIFIGRKLAGVTGIKDYEITEKDAADIAFCIDDICMRRGWRIASEINLLILLGLWLGFPTLEYMKKKKKEEEKAGGKKKLTFWQRLMGMKEEEQKPPAGYVPAPATPAPEKIPQGSPPPPPGPPYPQALPLGPVTTATPAVSIQPQPDAEPGSFMGWQGDKGQLHAVGGPEVTSAPMQPIAVAD